MKIQSRYLKLGVGTGEPQEMTLCMNGVPTYSFQLDYKPEAPEFYMYADLHPWMGKEISAEYGGNEITELILVEEPENSIGEDMRPLIHFTSPWGWHNDPNGLSYYEGKYRLFYQHNPFGEKWGNMHWGYAESEDLVKWSWVKDALYPDRIDATMYSGSAVVDTHNTAGFGEGAHVLIYTCADNGDAGYSQNLAWSIDGLNYHKYEGNPVIGNLAKGNRDPKVIWHEKSGKWVLALYLIGEEYAIFTSKNLKDWTEIQRLTFPNANECPDFFPLVTPEGEEKWVFWEAGNKYLLGDFDGNRFVFDDIEREVSPREASPRLYAAQTFYNDPKGRRIILFWETIQFAGAPFTSQMSIPCVLSLVRDDKGILKLKASPAEEYTDRKTALTKGLPIWFESDLLNPVEVDGHIFRAVDGGIAVDDKEYKTKSTRVSVLIDKMSAEIFADDGTLIHLYEGKFALSGEIMGAEKAYSIKL